MCQQSLWRSDDDRAKVYAAGGGARSHRYSQTPKRGSDRPGPWMPPPDDRAQHQDDHDRFVTALHVLSRPSMALARTREALHNSWDKNDPKDAQVILHMLSIGATMAYQDPLASGINDLQELSKTHEFVSKAKTEIWHRLLTH